VLLVLMLLVIEPVTHCRVLLVAVGDKEPQECKADNRAFTWQFICVSRCYQIAERLYKLQSFLMAVCYCETF